MSATPAWARLLGAGEAGAGIGALVFGTRLWAGLVALLYLAFAAFVAVLMTTNRTAGCGCSGRESPPTFTHLSLNLSAAGIAAAVAISVGGARVPLVPNEHPLLVVIFGLMVTIGVVLAYAMLGLRPRGVLVSGSMLAEA